MLVKPTERKNHPTVFIIVNKLPGSPQYAQVTPNRFGTGVQGTRDTGCSEGAMLS